MPRVFIGGKFIGGGECDELMLWAAAVSSAHLSCARLDGASADCWLDHAAQSLCLVQVMTRLQSRRMESWRNC